MDLVYIQIECEHSFSKMLASQQSDKTGLDVTLEYFESKLEVALTTLDTSEIYEVYLLHSDVTIAHPILGHSYEYSSILEYENSPSGIKKKLIEDWFNAGSKNKKSSPSIVVIAALENQGEIELFEKLIPSTDELMGNVSVIFFRKDKQWSMSQYDKTAEKFEGIVSGDTSYLIPISNLQIENLDRTIKFLGLSKQKSPFFLDYLISLRGTPSSTSDAYEDDDHGEGMDLDDVYDDDDDHGEGMDLDDVYDDDSDDQVNQSDPESNQQNTFLFRFNFETQSTINEQQIFEIIRDAVWSCSFNATEGGFSIIENDTINTLGEFPAENSSKDTSNYIPLLEVLKSQIASSTLKAIISRGTENHINLICTTSGDFSEHYDYNFKTVEKVFSESLTSILEHECDTSLQIYGPMNDSIISMWYRGGGWDEGYFMDIDDFDSGDLDESHLLDKDNPQTGMWSVDEIRYVLKNYWNVGKSKPKSKRTHSDEFKKQVAEAASRQGATLKSVGAEFNVNPTLVRNWKLQFGSMEETKSTGGGSDFTDEKTLISEVEKKYGSDEHWEILKEYVDIINEDGPSFYQFRQLGYALNGDFEDELLGLYAFRICLQLASDETEIEEIVGELSFIDPNVAEQIDTNPDDAVAIIDSFIASK